MTNHKHDIEWKKRAHRQKRIVHQSMENTSEQIQVVFEFPPEFEKNESFQQDMDAGKYVLEGLSTASPIITVGSSFKFKGVVQNPIGTILLLRNQDDAVTSQAEKIIKFTLML